MKTIVGERPPVLCGYCYVTGTCSGGCQKQLDSWWNIYNCILDDAQYYNGNAQEQTEDGEPQPAFPGEYWRTDDC